MSVMNERLEWLALSADRPDVVLQILTFEGPYTVLGALSANLGLAPGDAVRQDAAGTISLWRPPLNATDRTQTPTFRSRVGYGLELFRR